MGRGDGGRKFRGGDEHVRLEIVHALIEPKVDGFSCIIRAGELVQLQSPTASAFKIGSRNMDLRARRFALVNLLLELKIGVRLERTGGAYGCDATSKVQTWKAERHLAKDAVTHGIKHMVVHADKAGDDTVAVEIEHLSIFGDIRRRGIRDRFNLSLGD